MPPLVTILAAITVLAVGVLRDASMQARRHGSPKTRCQGLRLARKAKPLSSEALGPPLCTVRLQCLQPVSAPSQVLCSEAVLTVASDGVLLSFWTQNFRVQRAHEMIRFQCGT